MCVLSGRTRILRASYFQWRDMAIKPIQSRVREARINKNCSHSWEWSLAFLNLLQHCSTHYTHSTNCCTRKAHGFGKQNTKRLMWQQSSCCLKEVCLSTMPIKLFFDASAYGLRARLTHLMPNGDVCAIAYASRRLIGLEKKICTGEAWKIDYHLGVCRFHQYLYGKSFTLVTDHKSLCKS